jgi:hypothetical protein
MCRIAILSSIVLCITLALVGVDQLAPQWTKRVGLDFWNLDQMDGSLKDENTRSKRIDYELEKISLRREMVDRITLDLCDYRITLVEAVELMLPIINSNPVWYSRVQLECNHQGVSASNDREMVIQFLRANIHGLADIAIALRKDARAAAIANRLAHLEIEIREVSGSRNRHDGRTKKGPNLFRVSMPLDKQRFALVIVSPPEGRS